MLPPVIICAEAHRFYVLNQLQQLNITPAAVILEPAARNTTAAIALASAWAASTSTTATLAILAADHLMGSPTEFQNALHNASQSAEKNIVLFGINPSFANTEYGYIKLGAGQGHGAFRVEKFLEKPNRAAAEAMLLQGNHVWNSGMFTVAPQLLEKELHTHAPVIAAAVDESWQHRLTEVLMGIQIIRPAAIFANVPAEQFDTSVMEKTSHAVVLPYTGRWSDIGGFAALSEALPQAENGNSISAPDDATVLAPDTTGTLIHTSIPGKIIAVHGLSDAVIVDTHDALLVTTKSRASGVKAIFQHLQQQSMQQAELPHRAHRPWGWGEVILKGPGYQVKRLGVVPGGRLSLQYHHHRTEHWTVVTGTATVTTSVSDLQPVFVPARPHLGKPGNTFKVNETEYQSFDLNPDESVYLPLGTHHRLENKTNGMVEIIEVQLGKIITEEDIVRIEDVYKRA